MAIPNSTYTEALSTAIANYSPNIADNILNNNALLAYLKKNGNSTPFDGGVEILQNLSYAGNQNVMWYSGGQELDVSGTDTITTANFAIKQAATNVVFTGREQAQHSGKAAVHDFFKSKVKNAESALMNAVGASLFYSNTEQNGLAIGGLQHLVADTNNVGTVGGIDSSAQTFWQNVVVDFSNSSFQGALANANTIGPALDSGYAQTTFGSQTVDLVLMGATYYNYYERSLQAQQRFMTAEKATMGFNGYAYKNATVVLDSNCSATRAYMLNTNYFHFRPWTKRNFVADADKASVNQDAWVSPLYFMGNLTISGRNKHAVLVA